jgi:hypothetical protein
MDEGFEYPENGHLELKDILSVTDIEAFKVLERDPKTRRRAIKRGSASGITIGTLSGFLSYKRSDFVEGEVGTLEVAILTHEEKPSEAFSVPGDSGAAVVDAKGRLVALLTCGSPKITLPSLDITYATPMEWVWTLIKAKFPDAELNVDNLRDYFPGEV